MMEQISQDTNTPAPGQLSEKKPVVEVAPYEVHDEIDGDTDGTQAKTMSTRGDAEHMRRMGKQQQLVRRFRFMSVASFVALATASWELGMFVITPGLLDGGRAGLLYNMIWTFIGFAPIYLSMAEMSSMAPIDGGQYHWVSEFAPENMQRVLSYLTGWTSTLAWQCGNAIGVFLVGTLIQSIIQINFPDYSFAAWHATMLVIGAVIITYLGNTFGAKVLPYWQNSVFVLHVLAYFALIIPIWVNAPKTTHKAVWTEFENNGGWSNMVVAVLIGQQAGIYSQTGVDTAAHMAEEVKDAGKVVPRAMLTVYVVNFVLVFPVIVTLCYHMPVVTDALADPTLYPAIWVLRQTMSPAWITVMLVVIVLLLVASNVAYLAATTRDLFAFSRDHGMPFSDWIAKVDDKRQIPQNACIVSSLIAIGLGLIYIGSPLAFYAISSLGTVAILQSYCLSISCILWRRIKRPETLPPCEFSLGKFGIPLNIIAVAFSFWYFFWAFWIQSYPVTAPDFNWAVLLFFTVLIGAALDFVFRGRHKYHGPVRFVKGRFPNTTSTTS